MLSFGLRFWQLGRFESLVFDEVYFAKFAKAYLEKDPAFDAHPPLGKYFIAAGIWLYRHSPWVNVGAQAVTDKLGLVTISYRWMNAFVGSLIPLVVVKLSQVLVGPTPKRWLFGCLAGAFIAIDGLFVTESRHALLNIYVVFFGLAGHWMWLSARESSGAVRARFYRALSGVALGAAIATKWNGLGYILALVIWEAIQQTQNRQRRLSFLFQAAIYLGVLPLITYSLIWWPHLQLIGDSFWATHHTIFTFHQELSEVQVACSRWFTWPLLIKPISYGYEEIGSWTYTINNLGNPVLWLLSDAALILLTIDTLRKTISRKVLCTDRLHISDQVTRYLLIGYLANWLPWMIVRRCTYNYLYMPAAVFSFMVLAWLLSGWMETRSPILTRRLSWIMLSAIALAFLFWLPLSLGLPLTPDQLQLRWWLPSWI
ncbi:MAG: phospholipid carrier-dependent glycosyltransferase [Cyanobacteria bacterium J06598_1]